MSYGFARVLDKLEKLSSERLVSMLSHLHEARESRLIAEAG